MKLANIPTHISNYLRASSPWAEGLETPIGVGGWEGLHSVTWLILTSPHSRESSCNVSAMTQTLWIQKSFQWGSPTNDFLSLHKWKWQAPLITVNICLLSANRPSVVPGVYLWLQNWICSCLRDGNQSVHKLVHWSHQWSLKHHNGNFTITADRAQDSIENALIFHWWNHYRKIPIVRKVPNISEQGNGNALSPLRIRLCSLSKWNWYLCDSICAMQLLKLYFKPYECYI